MLSWKRAAVEDQSPDSSEEEILAAYNLQTSAFITKPIDCDEFITVVKSLEEFWLIIVKLPQGVSSKIYAY